MIRKLLVITFLVFLPITTQAAPVLLEDFNTHFWAGPGWGGRSAIVTNTSIDGRNVLSAVAPDTTGDYMPIKCNTFPNEDWTNVNIVRVEIMTLGPASTGIKFEMHASSDAQKQAITVNNVSSGTWQDLSFTGVDISTPVCWLNITAEPLGTNECTFYVDDIRLVLDDGSTWYYDDFNRAQKNYNPGGSYTAFNTFDPGNVSHVPSSSTINPGAGVVIWKYNSVDPYAEIQITGLNEDWKNYNTIRADIYLKPDLEAWTTAIPLKFYMWFGARGDGQNTEYKYISSSCTWQRIYWNLPSYTTYWNVTECKPGIDYADLYPGGTYYIDNITIGKIDLTNIVKSTSVTQAKPGEEVTVTLSYDNIGDLEAPNLYITEVIPFNTYLSEAPATGSADSVQYYVGSSWTGTYDAAATKVRWKDIDVPPGTGYSVSYKLRIR